MLGGIATTLAQAAGLGGGLKADYAVLEVDEASARRVFKYIKPDYMIITNLFRDQLDRYGEIDITVDLLNEAIDMADGGQADTKRRRSADRAVRRGQRGVLFRDLGAGPASG